MDYDGPQLEIVLRDPKSENTDQIVEGVLSEIPNTNKSMVAMYLKDKPDGPLTTSLLN